MMGKITSLEDALHRDMVSTGQSIGRKQYIHSPSFQNLLGAKDEVDGLSAAVGVVEGRAVRQVSEVVSAVRTEKEGWVGKEE